MKHLHIGKCTQMDIQNFKENFTNHLESTLESIYMECEKLIPKCSQESYQNVTESLTSSEYQPMLDAQSLSGET